jgi:hypothetical protein
MEPTTNIPAGVPVKKIKGAGGTPGGFGSFFLGLALLALGGYLIFSHVQVTTAFGGMWGAPFARGGGGFGPLLILLMLGVGFLFFDGKSYVGWILSVGSIVAIVVQVIMNTRLWFPQTSLLNTVLMFGSLAAGMGLVARSLKSYPPPGE